MFEGLVRQLLAGYLGRYVKDLQLKIGLWNEEVLLENVELILEAFDYLQLPLALKQGRVGKLSIKIPWKKLGWDPIIISLEDVFICACQRDDDEWSLDSVRKREISGKKAKLAGAELAKLSRRVCDNQAGQSFISYISAKILDGIQVSIRNVHIIYIDKQSGCAEFIFGLRFSSLSIMTDSRPKLNSFGSSSGKFRGSQVNKTVEILSLGIYCNSLEEASNSFGVDDESFLFYDSRFGSNSCDYILAPVDVVLSLVVNKSGKLEQGGPQYNVTAELSTLVVLLNEIQLLRILILLDYLSTCALREKYGRFRPWRNPLSRKLDGWQRMWWHYAQESVLSDVRRKLRKTSWSNFGRRLSYRRKYVSLYKRKLELLHQEQPVDEDILQELEQMERESEIEDILSYRSIAEHQLQEFLSNSLSSNTAVNGSDTKEKQQNDEQAAGEPRGWLNWLSLGMLGAGGTADSSQFAGVVSDEIIKDIYEATKFHPLPSFDGGISVKEKVYLSSIKFNIHQIVATLGSKNYSRETVRLIFDDATIKCKILEDSVTILSMINSVKMVDPCTENAILITKETIFEESVVKHGQPFVNSELRMSSLDHGLELSIKVVLQPFEVTYDSSFLFGIMDFHHVLSSVQFQHERVLASLNRFENFKARVLSKAEYIFSSRTTILWDVSFNNVIIKIPWRNNNSELYIMVVESGAVLFKSVPECDPLLPTSEHRYDNFFLSILSSTYPEELSSRVQDIYDYFKIDLTGFEVNLIAPNLHQALSIIERFNASVSLGSCMFLEESMLKQLEVHAIVPSFGLQFSPSVYDALVKLSAFLDVSQKRELCNEQTEKPSNSNVFKCSVSVNVEHAILHVNLENDLENSLILAFSLGKIDMQYDLQEFVEEFCVCIKALEVSTSSSKGEATNYILCSSRDCSFVSSANQSHEDVEFRLTNETFDGKRGLAEGCLLLQYQSLRSVCRVSHGYMVCMNGVDLHCHPRIIGLLQEFYDKLSRHDSLPFPSVGNSFGHGQETFGQEQMSGIRLQKYGFSNYCETGSFSSAGIPLDCFPFVTIYNSGSLGTLENSLVQDISEWRSLHVKDREFVRSQPFISRKRSRIFSLSTMKSMSSLSTSAVSESSDDSHPFVIDFNLNDIRVYFHDSSCILATMTVPSSISSVFVHGFECWDILGSTDGLLLSSSWSNLHVLEFIYGPASPNCASILNFRVRKGKGEQFPPETGREMLRCLILGTGCWPGPRNQAE